MLTYFYKYNFLIIDYNFFYILNAYTKEIIESKTEIFQHIVHLRFKITSYFKWIVKYTEMNTDIRH
jgi:hypothetical protein